MVLFTKGKKKFEVSLQIQSVKCSLSSLLGSCHKPTVIRIRQIKKKKLVRRKENVTEDFGDGCYDDSDSQVDLVTFNGSDKVVLLVNPTIYCNKNSGNYKEKSLNLIVEARNNNENIFVNRESDKNRTTKKCYSPLGFVEICLDPIAQQIHALHRDKMCIPISPLLQDESGTIIGEVNTTLTILDHTVVIKAGNKCYKKSKMDNQKVNLRSDYGFIGRSIHSLFGSKDSVKVESNMDINKKDYSSYEYKNE